MLYNLVLIDYIESYYVSSLLKISISIYHNLHRFSLLTEGFIRFFDFLYKSASINTLSAVDEVIPDAIF
jgi:hypothetical protein